MNSTLPCGTSTRPSTTFARHPLVPRREARQALRRVERGGNMEPVADRRGSDGEDLAAGTGATITRSRGTGVSPDRRRSLEAGSASVHPVWARSRTSDRDWSFRTAHAGVPDHRGPGGSGEALRGTHRLRRNSLATLLRPRERQPAGMCDTGATIATSTAIEEGSRACVRSRPSSPEHFWLWPSRPRCLRGRQMQTAPPPQIPSW